MRHARLAILACALVAFACSSEPGTTPPPTNACAEPEMATTFGGKSGSTVQALFAAPDGTLSVAGTFDDLAPSTSNAIDDDVVFLRLAADGTELARKTYTSGQHDVVLGAAFDSNGAVGIVGYSNLAAIAYGTQTTKGGYAVALDPSGAPKWLRPMTNTAPYGIAWASDGSAWVVGSTSDLQAPDLGTGPLPKHGTFVAHLGADGAVIAVHAYTTFTRDHRIAIGPDGAVYFGGGLAGTLDLDGNAVTAKAGAFLAKLVTDKVVWATGWDTGFSGTALLDLAPHAAGVRALVHFGSSSAVIGGVTYTSSAADFGLIVSLDSNGSIASATQMQTNLGSLSAGGAFDDGATVVGGASTGKLGPRIATYDPTTGKFGGTSLACTSFTAHIAVSAVTKDASGNPIVGGTYDVPGPKLSGGATVVRPTAFVVRMKTP